MDEKQPNLRRLIFDYFCADTIFPLPYAEASSPTYDQICVVSYLTTLALIVFSPLPYAEASSPNYDKICVVSYLTTFALIVFSPLPYAEAFCLVIPDVTDDFHYTSILYTFSSTSRGIDSPSVSHPI